MRTNTPSPHRFLNSASQRKPKPKPPSNLRHGVTAQTPAAVSATHALGSGTQTTQPRATPAKRFIIAPHRSPQPHVTHATARGDEVRSQGQSAPRPKPPRTLQRVESIEDNSQDSLPPSLSDDCYEVTDHEHARGQEANDGGHEDDDAELLFTPPRNHHKRRRLFPEASSSPFQPGSGIMHDADPPAPATVAPSHRFIAAASRTPAPPNTVSAAAPSIPTRPHFILPPQPTSPAKASAPLPETFSPSRKGQKFIAGGLASTLQSWIIETANTGYQAQIKDTVVWGRDKEDGVKMRFKISSAQCGRMSAGEMGIREGVECSPGDVAFVRGDMDSLRGRGEEREVEIDAKVLLGGQGAARGSSIVKLREGDVVGIRAPTWHVAVGSETWMVGVDWVVL